MKKISLLILTIMSLFSCNTKAQDVPSKAEDISPVLIGEKLSNAQLKNAEGQDVSLGNVLKEKPTVLVFYRGGWCPYCNLQLSGLASIEKDVLDLGYQIVAISPDDYQNLSTTVEADKINYQLLSDEGGKYIQEIGIAFQTPAMLKAFVATKKHKGKTSAVMPVPTVMIVNQESEILFEYINPNYKQRLSGEMLLAVLQTLKK